MCQSTSFFPDRGEKRRHWNALLTYRKGPGGGLVSACQFAPRHIPRHVYSKSTPNVAFSASPAAFALAQQAARVVADKVEG